MRIVDVSAFYSPLGGGVRTYVDAKLGAGPRLEVWDSAVWNAYLEETEQSFADTAEEVIPGLF